MNNTSLLGDKPINRIGFGAMQLAGPGVFGPPRDPDAARAVLRRAVELGVDHIDTSQYYGPDTVNDLIRETLHPYPENLKLVTKVGARRDEAGGWLPALAPHELREGVEANLRSLRVERMDLVNLRLMSDAGGTDVPLPEQLGELEDLRTEGKLDLIGVSNVTREGVERALGLVDLGEVQNAYSILHREHEDIVELCRAREIAFVPFFPLGSAFTGGPRILGEDPAIAAVARKHAATPSQVALAWLLARYDRMLLIPGTTSVVHLEENLASAEVELDDEDIAPRVGTGSRRPSRVAVARDGLCTQPLLRVDRRRTRARPDLVGRGESTSCADGRRPSHRCYSYLVARRITQRQLRNESGEVMRALDAGDSFLVTRNGVAVGELTPVRRHRFVSRDVALTTFSSAPPIDARRFRADVDRLGDQDPAPRG